MNKDMKSKYDKWSGAVGEKTIYKATIESYHYTVRITLAVYQQKTSKKWTHDLFLILTSNMTFSYRNIIQVYLLVSNW